MYHNSGAFRPSAHPLDSDGDSDDSGAEQLDEDTDIDMLNYAQPLASGFDMTGNAALYAAAPPLQSFANQFNLDGALPVSPAGSGWASGESRFAGAEWTEAGEQRGHSSEDEIDASDSEVSVCLMFRSIVDANFGFHS